MRSQLSLPMCTSHCIRAHIEQWEGPFSVSIKQHLDVLFYQKLKKPYLAINDPISSLSLVLSFDYIFSQCSRQAQHILGVQRVLLWSWHPKASSPSCWISALPVLCGNMHSLTSCWDNYSIDILSVSGTASSLQWGKLCGITPFGYHYRRSRAGTLAGVVDWKQTKQYFCSRREHSLVL